jgi:hypothetical protein
MLRWWRRRESNPSSALKTLKLLILRMPEICRIPRLPGLRTNRVQRISGTPRIPAVASSDPFGGRSEVFSDLYTSVPSAMAGDRAILHLYLPARLTCSMTSCSFLRVSAVGHSWRDRQPDCRQCPQRSGIGDRPIVKGGVKRGQCDGVKVGQ